ncbi:hypothetical protein [Blastopirellula marina]|uniref:Uncharacterized protein n=1 Tax=Blastopirellula marina TaxID=124 RepID=A0A2S8GI51_9BACT|nr:hypothetical protein [Blastopirellula marina]PQO44129.1 hypothetical protein C5Y93_21575 [Blastopirellula marina]
MNSPEENPYASPCVDEIVLAEPGDIEIDNRDFYIESGKVVGVSRLHLPEVYFYCAADIVDDDSRRKCAKFYRRHREELRPPTVVRLFYSVCSGCASKDDAWTRRGSIVFNSQVVAAILSVVLIFELFSVIAIYESAESEFAIVVGAIVFFLLGLCGVAAFGAIVGCEYCSTKVSKTPKLVRFDGDMMVISRAGKKFCERYG